MFYRFKQVDAEKFSLVDYLKLADVYPVPSIGPTELKESFESLASKTVAINKNKEALISLPEDSEAFQMALESIIELAKKAGGSIDKVPDSDHKYIAHTGSKTEVFKFFAAKVVSKEQLLN